jgi:hypothetical protein
METWSNTSKALELLARQRWDWPELKAGYEALERMQVKTLSLGGLKVKVQYNPARSLSSAARTDALYLRERPCFLCPSHLPHRQEKLPMGSRYLLLCNPYPIFPEHFTIAARRHTPQLIKPYFADFLMAAKQLSGLTLFYNGPQCGASAPDHLHFQAVTRSYMPIDTEAELHKGLCLLSAEDGSIHQLERYLRAGFVLESTTEAGACALFERLYKVIRALVDGDDEPRMNLFCQYIGQGWQVIVIPRMAHRPWQFHARGDDQILVSPGAADIGGVFVTTREEDYWKISPTLLREIYKQLVYTNRLIVECRRLMQ